MIRTKKTSPPLLPWSYSAFLSSSCLRSSKIIEKVLIEDMHHTIDSICMNGNRFDKMIVRAKIRQFRIRLTNSSRRLWNIFFGQSGDRQNLYTIPEYDAQNQCFDSVYKSSMKDYISKNQCYEEYSVIWNCYFSMRTNTELLLSNMRKEILDMIVKSRFDSWAKSQSSQRYWIKMSEGRTRATYSLA